MDPISVITRIASIIQKISQLAPTAIQTVNDAKPFAQLLYHTLAKGEKVTETELDELEAKITDLSNQLQKPLDPE